MATAHPSASPYVPVQMLGQPCSRSQIGLIDPAVSTLWVRSDEINFKLNQKWYLDVILRRKSTN
jgi:hypothetical protein